MSLGNLNGSPALFSSAELFFLLQERIVLYCIIFLFSKDRKQEASAGVATHARRYLTSLETVLTFWSEIALDRSDSVANTPYTHYLSGFYQRFSYSNMNSPSALLYVHVHIHTHPRCPNVQMTSAYRQLGLQLGMFVHPKKLHRTVRELLQLQSRLHAAFHQIFSWCSLKKAGPSSF